VNKVDGSGRLCCDSEECQADAEGREQCQEGRVT